MSDGPPRDETTAHHADDSAKPSASDVRAELQRILSSRCFQQAGRASHFLRFVVEETLAGNGQRLKGYTIGVEVFGRPVDFDAQSDALVRVEAGRLRRRLVEYYATEGAADPVRIELPRGSYAVDYSFVNAEAPSLHESVAAANGAAEPQAAAFSWRRVAASLAALLLLAVGVIVWQQSALREAGQAVHAAGDAQRTEWPRIVVVPFENLGGDRALDSIAASMTEEIMLRLDELDLFVIASQASWYGPSHEKSLDAAAGGYLLTGSVRGTAEKARITVRLIEASSGAQLWTAAYDEALAAKHLPPLQERVARDVMAISATSGPIFEAELARARRAGETPTLRDCLATYQDYRRRVVPQVLDAALDCYENVTARQPDVAQAWSGLALLHIDDFAASFGRTGDGALAAARTAAEKGLGIDRDNFHAILALARVQFFNGDPAYRQTIERALVLRPTSAQALAQSGFLFALTGDSANGLLLAQRAVKQSKKPPSLTHLTYAVTYLREGRFAEALASAQKVTAQNWVIAHAVAAAAAAHGGFDDAAAKAAGRVKALYPDFESDVLVKLEYWHFDPALREVFLSGLEAAGFVVREPAPLPSGG
jgi:adenylate cyclase